MKLDENDLRILEMLKESSELTISQISKKTRIPITTVHNRIKKLKSLEVIRNYTVNINFEKIGKPLKCHILITVEQGKLSQSQMGKQIKAIEGVQAVDIVTGNTDILAEVRVKDMHELNRLITEKIRKIDGIDKTQTLMVLEEIK